MMSCSLAHGSWRRGRSFIWNFFVLSIAILLPFEANQASEGSRSASEQTEAGWHSSVTAQASLRIEPVREDALSRDGIRLALKHYPRPGAQPIILIHGLAQNDRGWDPQLRQYSFARFLHSEGFDVWVGNMRGAGTPGFRSDTPPGPHHWSVDDYAASDVPALIDAVREKTGQPPFVVAHSLGAWAIEGYLAGVAYKRDGTLAARNQLALARTQHVRGVVTLSGVYNLKWKFSASQAHRNPIRSEADYYHSNYELELLSRVRPLYYIVPNLPRLPLGWVSQVVNFRLDQIPIIGGALQRLYQDVQEDLIRTPILNMLYYAPDVDPELVRQHAQDGLEDLSPHVIEQLANAIQDRRTSAYYHLDRPQGAYDYASVRRAVEVPILFVGGGRDRMASAYEVYEDGYLKTVAKDKEYLHVEAFGHMDILNGKHAPQEVMAPVAEWLHRHI